MKELPFAFGYSFFVRVVLPGELGTVFLVFLLWPLARSLWPSLDSADKFAGLIALVLLIGVLTWLLDGPIYWLYEGLSWPARLRGTARRRLQKRVSRALERAETLKKTDYVAYSTLWHWLRGFPIGEDGIPIVTSATELGNVLAAAESYPKSRYGMSSQFYWYRIWLSLDEGARTTIDQDASKLDGMIYLSFVLLCTSCLYFMASAVQLVSAALAAQTIPYLQDPRLLTLGAVLAALGSHSTYKISLPLARSKGEHYKSIFDLYRANVEAMTRDVSESEKQQWDKTWRYLQYQQIQCPQCGQFHEVSHKTCPHCSSRGVWHRIIDRLKCSRGT